MLDIKKKIKAVVLGHAVADALGVPVEFCKREELQKNPVTDMMGFGTYPVPEGSWSDDTSMALAALDSIKDGKVDFDDIMLNFGKWYYNDEYTPTGEMFDVGNTCSLAIHNYTVKHLSTSECGPSNERSNGNGSLMRIHPFSLMAWFNRRCHQDFEAFIEKASALTHAHERSILACKIYTVVLFHLLAAPKKESVILGLDMANCRYFDSSEHHSYERLFELDFRNTPIEEIKSTGYVVHSLEAAIWCVLTTDSYKECVLKAVNLGDDTDTVAAIAGGLAGALYGLDAIPFEWLGKLKQREYIEEMCDKAADGWC